MKNQRDSDLFYLKSILLAIDNIDSYGFSSNPDKKTLRAVTYELMTIGEAATKISVTLKKANPHVPWNEIEGTRHRIVHEYFRIDPAVIAEIVRDDLKPLETFMGDIIRQIEVQP
jgi:uncharacterized protein with HEPN domain